MERWRNRRTWTEEAWLEDSKMAHKLASDRTSEYYLRYADIMKEKGYIHEAGYFKLCGLTLSAACFCVGGYDYFSDHFHKNYLEINEASINECVLTLDEWFERDAIRA